MMYVFAIILLVFSYVHGMAVAQTASSSYYDKNTCLPGPHDLPNPSPEPDAPSPDIWYYQIPTTVVGQFINDDTASASVDKSAGMVLFEVHRAWSPLGADRFYALVQDNYYNCAAFFRIVPNFIVQWGIASNPTETNKWNTNIEDDPLVAGLSNTVGMVSFAMAGPNTRTTQIFVNTADNSPLDSQGFTPFAKVMQGMEIFMSGSTMSIPSPVPDQFMYESEGNPWILQNYPAIDLIKGVGVGGVSSSSPNIFLSLNETSTETTANITTESPTSTTSNATTETETSFNETVAPSTDGSLNGTTAPSTEVSLNETAITDITDTDTDTDTSIDSDSSTSPATNKVASLNTNTSSTGTSTGIAVSTTIFCCAIVTTLIISFSAIM